VIIEEINMYHDNPVMYIEDVFEKCLYGDTPAGREIAGPKENIRKFKRQDFLNYFSSQYGVNSGVLCLAGRIDQRSEALAEKYFGKFRRTDFKDKLGTPEAQSEPQIKIHVKDGDQVNLSLGVRTGNTYHPDRFILRVLSVVLGGSMSSRLFTEIREKRGLAYFIQTQTEFYTDTGYLTTRAGVPEEKTEEAIKTILVEYRRLKNRLVSESELRRAKDLIRGRTIIGFEESDAVANWLGRQAVLKEKLMSADEFFARIEAVKAEDLRRAARDIFRNEKLNLALIGPFRNYDPFRKILKL
jgi:predicted Zn-dependent peptidase